MYYRRTGYKFTKSMTFYLIAVNIIFFIIQLFIPWFTYIFELKPDYALSGMWWQFITYMFLHGGVFHITINMFVLAIFGFPLELVIGKKRFTLLYFISGVGSAIIYILFTGTDYALIGASGAVFGVLAAYAFKFPRSWVYIFGLFPLPAALLIVLLLIEESFYGLMGAQPGIANFGHVGGILTGLALMFLWKVRDERKKQVRDFEFIWE
ncbi:MAG: rhomboid family intramembrane serine protease [Candidatus Aenigmarchaeota archaeon]|nr:rhomboid family intramembrane serine protease [Candidatus Aenigmarchaeota archaeon]